MKGKKYIINTDTKSWMKEDLTEANTGICFKKEYKKAYYNDLHCWYLRANVVTPHKQLAYYSQLKSEIFQEKSDAKT